MTAYYNENDPYAAQWLRNLVSAGRIAPGEVDERSIEDVTPNELANFTQCHFFAGVGIWSHALRLAGWPDDRPVWTGSCPCQPFSAAGKGAGFADERHLWPAWFHLIEQRRPETIFGEQVASGDGLAWLDLVQADLEAARYAFAPFDLCAAGIGAPHIRQRLYFVADSDDERSQGRRRTELRERADQCTARTSSASGWVADASVRRCELGSVRDGSSGAKVSNNPVSSVAAPCPSSRMGDAGSEGARRNAGAGVEAQGRLELRAVGDAPESPGSDDWLEQSGSERRQWREAATPGHYDDRQASERPEGEHGPGESSPHRIHTDRAGPTNGFWRAADWLGCRDGKWRPVEPGTFPLAHGVAGRVGRLRAYGNAIVAPQAVEFIRAYCG